MGIGLETFAYAALGILVGSIYAVDGWQSPRDPSKGLIHSPKLQGLLYILGASLIPTIQILQNADSEALQIYTSAMVVSAVVVLIALALYSLTLSYSRLRDLFYWSGRWRLLNESVHLATITFQHGWARFREESDAYVVQELVRQRDGSVLYLTGVLDSLVDIANEYDPTNPSIETFTVTVQNTLSEAVQKCLEQTNEFGRFRASFYVYSGGKSLAYLAGASPPDFPHSRRPLDSEESLAGWAIQHPGRAYHWPRQSPGNDNTGPAPFESRDYGQAYSSVSAYSPQRQTGEDLCFAISIDCQDLGLAAYGEYVGKMLYALSVIVVNIASSMGITRSILEDWLREQES